MKPEGCGASTRPNRESASWELPPTTRGRSARANQLMQPPFDATIARDKPPCPQRNRARRPKDLLRALVYRKGAARAIENDHAMRQPI